VSGRIVAVALCVTLWSLNACAGTLRVAVFEAEVTPPLGTPLCGGGVLPAQRINDPLGARGIVLLPEGQEPIVLCAVDWVGIANTSHDAWRQALADAAGTPRARVAVHTLHQHDAPFADDATDALLKPHGMGGLSYDPRFADKAIVETAEALREALPKAVLVDTIGLGAAAVEKVASNRRILGEDGKVRAVRWTACTDPALRAEPEGVIDPRVRVISFWHGDQPVVALSYYATHPQSFYNTGAVSADFVGMARETREAALGFPQIHFNGAAGNIGSGKYNDGSPENRPVLAGRLEEGMRRAWEATEKKALRAEDIAWKVAEVTLPRRAEVGLDYERARLVNPEIKQGERIQAAREIAWIERADQPTEIGCLTLGKARLLHLPGELFVEYQLAAQAMAPEAFVCMAAYGDYGPGYIGTAISYEQGGYEPEVYTSRTAPGVETVLMEALRGLLK
jgi:hypothetical protein